jgi:teichuronic acid biosynthesis glycosyltransferase TuaC
LKILFVSSGNTIYGISPITMNQGESLKNCSVEIFYFPIVGKGLWNYLISIKRLKKHLRTMKYDLIHAHYSLAGFVAALAGSNPIVVSLMGSDVKSNKYYRNLLIIFSTFSWKKVIVKSKDMQEDLKKISSVVIPNGVNLSVFKEIDKTESMNRLGWDSTKRNILFAANPNRQEKNFALAKSAVELLYDEHTDLHTLNNVPNEEMVYHYNAADVVLLTSLWEGSPNVIKEAMACNRPIVSTKVGDVEWLLDGVHGAYVCQHDAQEIATAIKQAQTIDTINAREKLLDLNLDSASVADALVRLYSSVSSKRPVNKEI